MRISCLLFMVFSALGRSFCADIDELKLEPKPFLFPKAEDHRFMLLGSVPAYLGEDSSAPVLRVTLLYRTGVWLDPPGKEGLAQAVAYLLRSGGTQKFSPEEFDQELEQRAVDLEAQAVQDSFSVELWSLSREGERALELLSEAVSRPRFDPNRLRLWKAREIQQLKALHDRSEEVARLYWRDLIWGKDHVVGRRPTRRSINSISQKDLFRWHRKYFRPQNLWVIATCDLPVKELKRLLEKELAAVLKSKEKIELKNPFLDLPKPPAPQPPGLYLVNIPVDKVTIRLGSRGIYWNDPKLLSLQLVSYIFGEGSFESRLTERLRTREGLTYGVFSLVIPGWVFPGTTIVQLNTDPPNVARVVNITLEELRRLKEKGVTQEEVRNAKRAMIARFAGLFENLHQALRATAYLEYRGRPLDYYVRYRERLRALKFSEINQAASSFLEPKELRVLIAGDKKKLKDSLISLSEAWKVIEVPLRDPLK